MTWPTCTLILGSLWILCWTALRVAKLAADMSQKEQINKLVSQHMETIEKKIESGPRRMQ